jgi:hypothetical protein
MTMPTPPESAWKSDPATEQPPHIRSSAIAQRREIAANLEAAAHLLLELRHYVTVNEATALCSHISAVHYDHAELIDSMAALQAEEMQRRLAHERARNGTGFAGLRG